MGDLLTSALNRGGLIIRTELIYEYTIYMHTENHDFVEAWITLLGDF